MKEEEEEEEEERTMVPAAAWSELWLALDKTFVPILLVGQPTYFEP